MFDEIGISAVVGTSKVFRQRIVMRLPIVNPNATVKTLNIVHTGVDSKETNSGKRLGRRNPRPIGKRFQPLQEAVVMRRVEAHDALALAGAD